jgi:hypothetical protein
MYENVFVSSLICHSVMICSDQGVRVRGVIRYSTYVSTDRITCDTICIYVCTIFYHRGCTQKLKWCIYLYIYVYIYMKICINVEIWNIHTYSYIKWCLLRTIHTHLPFIYEFVTNHYPTTKNFLYFEACNFFISRILWVAFKSSDVQNNYFKKYFLFQKKYWVHTLWKNVLYSEYYDID